MKALVCVVTVLIPWPGPMPAAGVKPDRAAFFRDCAVLTNFVLAADRETAVAVGKTRLSAAVVPRIELIFDAWEKRGDVDSRRLAFILATARRETQGTFAPLREVPKCGTDEECRERAIGAELARRANENNEKVPANYAAPAANGRRYYGRGLAQITGLRNYRIAKDATQIDFVNDPDRALEPAIAAELLVRSMLEGWFGSKKPLSHYIDGDKADWLNARNNINPRSPNKPIPAAMAKEFADCLRPGK